MEIYNAHVEVDRREEYDVDQLMTALTPYHAAVGTSPRGYADAQVSVTGRSLIEATATAVTVVEAAFGARAIACEVMTEKEFTAREGWEPLPELVSVTEAAEILGTSRSAVQQRIETGSLPGEKVGNSWVLPRNAVVLAAGPTHPDYPHALKAERA